MNIHRFLLLLLLLMSTKSLDAQVANATAAEKKVLDKAVPLIIQTLDQFNNGDWELTQDFYGGDISVNQKPDVPMDINQNFEREYRVKNNSDRYNTLVKPAQDKMKEALDRGDVSQVQKLSGENRKYMSFTVDVYINRKIATITPGEKGTIPTQVKGIDLCYHTNKDQYENETNTYFLLFGNWKTAKNGQYGLHYAFIHPAKTPYIENIVIILKGADDYLQHLLKTVDWSLMQNALTP
jgi:hypothetical protein